MATMTPKPATLDLSRCAVILHTNKLIEASASDPSKALTPRTSERWRSASGTMQATFQPGSSVVMNAIAIGAHNLGSTGSTIVVETAPTVAGTWTVRGATSPLDDKPILFLFDDVDDVEDVRITITDGTDREVGVIFAGEVMVMQQPIYGGHAPIDLQSVTTYRNTDSETGQFLGRDIIRKGTETSFNWQHLDPDWIRDTFKQFIEAAKTNVFFIKWRPDLYEVVALCKTTADIRPVNMGGGHKLMSVSVSVRGHDDI